MIRFLSFIVLCLAMSSCVRTRSEIWEDSKTASRQVSRGLCTLSGKQRDSRLVYNKDEFSSTDQFYGYTSGDEFIPIINDDMPDHIAVADSIPSQPAETPGDPGSSIPGVEAFVDPTDDPKLSPVFKQVRFPYNSNLVKGRENFMRIAHIADYMKRHPNTYVFIEGHCDERGPEAYNLALGSRRSNAVRNLLVSEGANPEHLFTISYGKERPIAFGHDEDAWTLNRRAEFKVYER